MAEAFAAVEFRPARHRGGTGRLVLGADRRIGLGATWRPLLRQLLSLLAIAALAAPALTPFAAAVRWTFPAGAGLIAGMLALRGRPASYIGFCLWLFMLTPMVRRLVDGHAGFSQANVLMLAPYLATAWCALWLPRFFLSRDSAIQLPIGGILLAIAYGFILALAAGRILPGTLDLLRWSAPPLLACFVLVNSKHWTAICSELGALALVGLPLISLYGIYQFVSPPSWDGAWMLNSAMTSIGQPRPFEVRVFSTLNSPASLSFYVVGLMLIVLTLRTPVRWLAVALGGAVLGLSLVRSAWLGLALGLLLLVARGSNRLRLSIVIMMLAGAALVPLALGDARTHEVVSSRVESLRNVAGDVSFSERTASYRAFGEEIIAAPWGQGLGIANVASNYTKQARVIDGGIIEIFLALGVVGGALYLGLTSLVVVAAFVKRSPTSNRDLFHVAGAILCLQLVELSSTTTVAGEIGVVFWLAAGLALGAPGRREAVEAA